MNSVLTVLAVGLVLLAGPARSGADVWDINDTDDDGSTSNNELFHGAVQVHDLAAQGAVADQDWVRVQTQPYSSYEAVLEGLTGRLGNGSLPNPLFERMNFEGSIVLGTAQAPPGSPFAYARTLRWENATATGEENYLRVRFASCNTSCDSNDQYTLRFWETSLAVPRFNNGGGQVTVLLVQNPTAYTITGHAFLWDVGGNLVGQAPFNLAPHALFSLNTSSVAPGIGGSITITHDGRYGDVTGKAVALEPATGFSFDSPMVPRPR